MDAGPDTVPATVLRRVQLTPRMVRVTLGGPALLTYRASGDPDECCRVVLPERPGDVVEQPPTASQRRAARIYTVRRYDPVVGEIDIDVVLHDGGPGARWARTARPGDAVAVTAAVGAYGPAPGVVRLQIVGDATALPAMARIVEQADAGTTVEFVAVVADGHEHLDLVGTGAPSVTWLHEPDPAVWGDALAAAVRQLGRTDPGTYVWVAGEAAGAREARRHLRHDRGLAGTSFVALGYWRHGKAGWDARYSTVAALIEREIARLPFSADAAGTADLDAYADAIDAVYDRHGL